MINKQKAIKDIIENFNWEKVHRAMELLEWTWFESEETPTIGKLFTCATRLLNDAYDLAAKEKEHCFCSTGGFHASALVDNKTKKVCGLKLHFEITSWSEDEDSQKYSE